LESKDVGHPLFKQGKREQEKENHVRRSNIIRSICGPFTRTHLIAGFTMRI
jgi:hypothetical protein